MTIYRPVVYEDNEHTPLLDGDVIAGSSIQISTDPSNTLSIATDGGLIAKPKGAWSSRAYATESGTYDMGLLDGRTGQYTEGYVHAHAPDDTNVVFTVDISTIPLLKPFTDGDPLSTLLVAYKVVFIVTWGLRASASFQFSAPVYLPNGGIGTTWACSNTPMDPSVSVNLGSNFFELSSVYDATRPILNRFR